MRSGVFCCCLWLTLASPIYGDIVVYTSESTFLSAAGYHQLESFETNEDTTSSMDPIFTDHFTVIPTEGACFIRSSPTGGHYSTDGVKYLTGGGPENGLTLVFVFEEPIRGFAISATDFGDFNPGELTFTANAGDASNGLIAATVPPQLPNANLIFYGFIQDTPFTQLIVSATSPMDGIGYDEIRMVLADCADCYQPNTLNVFRGVTNSGTLDDVYVSDDQRMEFSPGFTISSTEAPVWLIFEGEILAPGPLSINMIHESNAGTPGLTYTLEAWNWSTSAYDVVAIDGESFNDDTTLVSFISSDVFDYIEPNSRTVRSRVGWRKTGLTLNFPWEVRIDQFGWLAE